MSMFIVLFPKRLPLQSANHVTDSSADDLQAQEIGAEVNNNKNKDGFEAVKRVLKNKIFMLNLLSSLATIFFYSGYGTFIPKFFQVFTQWVPRNLNKLFYI